MTLLTALLKFIIGNLGTIIGLTNGISSNTAHAVQETTAYRVQDSVIASQGDIENITWGLFALYNKLLAIQATLATLQVAASPVVLPTTPPTGYGAPSSSTVAYDVWHFTLDTGDQAQAMQIAAGWLGTNMGASGVMLQSYTTPWFRIGGTWSSNVGSPNYNSDPIFPIANILATDTLPVFLDRESFYTGWTDPNGSGYYQVAAGGGSDFYYMSTITAAEFIVLRDGVAPGTVVLVPPIWPGLAGVTLGTPVAIDVGVTISVPMDGAIIVITAAPAKQGSFTFDTLTSWRNVGALAFVDDNGQAEFPQTLGFTTAVYCPKTMAQASGLVLRASAGVTGTITPWVVV